MAAETAKTQTLKFKRTVNVPPAEVSRAFMHATALRDWLCDAAQTDPHPGGRLYLWWNTGFYANGQFTALAPGKKLAFTWHGRGEPEPSRVQVSLAVKKAGTVVTVTHSGIGANKKWAATIAEIEQGWQTGLENLQSVLETGVDLRLARRPRLGILVGDFSPEIAAQLGVPVKQGIRLEGTFEETGARSAGLQKDDVIVKLGGRKAVDFPTLTCALQGHAAGDKVKMEFYRGPEKKSVTMELSRRPLPDVPPTAADLAQIVRQSYAALAAERAKFFEGVSEAEAAHRPDANTWNLNETVAHFIACERDFQSWLADMLNDNVVGDSLEFRPNVTARLAPIVARYPTLPALLEELKRSSEETVTLIAALPPEFVARRRHLYYRIASWITEVIPGHLGDEHGAQVLATIEAARK